MERDYERDEREKGDDVSSADSVINEGLILDDGVCPVGVSFGLVCVLIYVWFL